MTVTMTKDRHAIFDEVLGLLRGVQRDGDKAMAFCPNHEQDAGAGGHQRSLSVSIGDKGIVLHCFAKCLPAAVAHAIGKRHSELFFETGHGSGSKKRKSPKGKKTAEYDYRDSSGVLVFQAVRFEDPNTGEKTFQQRRPNGDGGWVYNLRNVPRVLYNLPAILAADKTVPIFIVEGEKKADALIKWGLIATCNVGGAGKWTRAYSEVVKGHPLFAIPDNDEPGLKHALDVLEKSRDLCPYAKIVNLPDLAPKGDVWDWIQAGGTHAQFMEIVEKATGEEAAVRLSEIRAAEEQKFLNNPLSLEMPDFRNDIGNGKRLIRDHGQDLKFCFPWDKWLIWTGKQWKIDDTGEARRRAKRVPFEMRSELRALNGQLPDGLKGIIQDFVNRTCNIGPIDRILTAATSEDGCQVLPYQLDAHSMLLNCQNGTIDLSTGQLRPHDRADLLTKISPVAFDPDATCPGWEKFLTSLFAGDQGMVSYVQRLCGYWATGVVREQIMPILHGSGANGKTTFLNAIKHVIGEDFIITGTADFLMSKKNDVHPTEKADLFGRRLVVCSETQEGRRLAESLVKELTGTERIRARRMREDFWEFEPTHKIVLCTNHKPMVTGTDVGIWRRMRLIPFTRKFWDSEAGETGLAELKQDKTLPASIRNEYSGILTWIIRGCLEWLHDGEGLPQPIRDSTAEYRNGQDLIGSFVSECCVEGEFYAIKASELYDAYKAWCEVNGEWSVNQRRFGMSMGERGYEKHKSSSIIYRKITTIGNANSVLE